MDVCNRDEVESFRKAVKVHEKHAVIVAKTVRHLRFVLIRPSFSIMVVPRSLVVLVCPWVVQLHQSLSHFALGVSQVIQLNQAVRVGWNQAKLCLLCRKRHWEVVILSGHHELPKLIERHILDSKSMARSACENSHRLRHPTLRSLLVVTCQLGVRLF